METTLSYHRAMAPRRRSARDEPASGDPTLFGAEHANALLVAYCPAATPDQLLGLLGQWGRDASVVTGLVRHRAATAEFLRLALDWCPSDAVTRGVAASRVTQRDDALFAYVLSRAENDPRAVAELIVRAGEARWLMVAPSFERLPTLARTVIAHPAFLARRHLTAAMLQPLLESREEDVRMAALVAMARAAPSSLPGAHASASPDIAPAAAPRRALTR
jgi:hypothetical protein